MALLVGLVAPARATVFGVKDVLPGINNGVGSRINYILGLIRCSEGMKYNVKVQVTKKSGATALGSARGLCTGEWQLWNTSEPGGDVDSTTGFSCGDLVLVEGQGRTEDGHKLTFTQKATVDCS